MRTDGRSANALRPIEILPGFHRPSEGSVLYRAGGTVVLCTASLESKVPPFLEGKGKGWLTAEYQMHPRANPPRRESRDGRSKPLGGRSHEIQRLIGRALRAAIFLDKLGERTLTVDCDVLEADGGTRTASITGGFVAMALAIDKLKKRGDLKEPVLREPIAAVSSGMLKDGSVVLDLCYVEDSSAEVDLNVVAARSGAIVEIQGTAEGAPAPRAKVDAMLDCALLGIAELVKIQLGALAGAGVDVATLFAAEKA
ncbi:MAG: ribonuclease PH [Myxococcales bacterium]|nr:ribonuclease PH [Myxococcales bacterium]